MKELPKKWCIKPDDEKQGLVIRDYINEVIGHSYYSESCTSNYYWHYPAYEKNEIAYCWTAPKNTKYKIITFEQFERWVLKKNEDYNYLIEVLEKHNVL